ncbi:replication initiation regulator SeqA [Gallaecimonas sp. GXIMD1310]|uniref:replication initiation regulator SeqA n=1 Tax=Gallaecimonas sp. GXIMD1310 TaxID=3131926 RepID=UPI0032527A72
MKTIDVDDDLYQYIASNTQRIGESASDILRRLLDVDNQPAPSEAPVASAALASAAPSSQPASHDANSAVGRFIQTLTDLHQRHGDDFKVVLSIRGRDRLYFATSAEALNQAGKSTNPKAIEGSPYWVVTNNNTAKKRSIVSQVMAALGYDEAVISATVNNI